MLRRVPLYAFALIMTGCVPNQPSPSAVPPGGATGSADESQLTLSPEEAQRLMELPLRCLTTEFPYKSGLVIGGPADLSLPRTHHPAFYGCFDWHSAVHGHWSVIHLMRQFPDLAGAAEAKDILSAHLTTEAISTEIAYFSLNRYTASFERTYGWAWLLKLAEELHHWQDDPQAQVWSQVLQPLADLIVEKYLDFLPRLTYPIRVGEHANTAFGLSFAWDYAQATGRDSLLQVIESRALTFYGPDTNCPLSWEPGGFDFLSPCLEEAALMSRILPNEAFREWLADFAPALLEGGEAILEPAVVSDRSDGKLVHLDGLNFSRAWCLYTIADALPGLDHLRNLADRHLAFSLSNIVDGDYAGEHWLASFALYALHQRKSTAQ